jgi:hypothetical protein
MMLKVRVKNLEPSPNASARISAPDRTLMGFGALTAAAGLYFCLVGFGMLPPPGRVNGPLWIVTCAGLVFLAGGVAVIVRGELGLDDRARELPNDAPAWLRTIYILAGLVAAAGLAGIGTWVAFGGGHHGIKISGPISGPVGDGIGRTAFGIGAIVTWILFIHMARVGARKLFGKKDQV